MKQTSINKLSEVYNALRDPENARINNVQAAEMIQQVIRAEAMTPAKAGKFNIYNYVAKDEIHPAMNGVFLNDGWKTASDSHILISIKEEYDKEFEGRVMYKDGSFYNIHRRVKDENGDWVDKLRTAWKTEHGKGIKWDGRWYCKVGPCVFQAELFSKLIEAMEYLGATEVLMGDSNRAAMVRSDKGVCILMPVMQPDSFGESNPNHIVL